jgi:cbb3-type cytochrome c oxidase subunit II
MQPNKVHFIERPVVILLGAAVGCFLLSLVFMGIAPWLTFDASNQNAPAGFENPYVDAQGKKTQVAFGRDVYIQEGCWHCHTQFVRPIAGEPYRYGPTSRSWDSMYDVPQLFGTRRVGPDLSREAGRRTDDWHIAHLFNPRFVAPMSVMPGYPWLFEKTANGFKPNEKGLALVAYIQYLGSPYKDIVEKKVYPDKIKVSGTRNLDVTALDRGQELFSENCVGCHGKDGNGESEANKLLGITAVDLKSRYIPSTEAYAILYSGVRGTAMPSFQEMPEKDLWAISDYVASLGEEVEKNWNESITSAAGKEGEGQELYQNFCLSCHGASGKPEGAIAENLTPAPRDLSARLFSVEYLRKVIKGGRPGTAMPPFAALTDDQINSLSHHLKGLFSGPKK